MRATDVLRKAKPRQLELERDTTLRKRERATNVPKDATRPYCEETLATTAQRCHKPASIVEIRFGEPFNLCAECALHEYVRAIPGRRRKLSVQNPDPIGPTELWALIHP
jgi:hypothetical protein